LKMLKKLINRFITQCTIDSIVKSNISVYVNLRNKYYISQSNNNDNIEKERKTM
jgi:hypothetical protein